MPSIEQLQAMGRTREDAQKMINDVNAINNAAKQQTYMSQQEKIADQGWTVLNSGMIPSAAQLQAMGITSEQAGQYIKGQQSLVEASKSAQSVSDITKLANLGWTSLESGIVPSAEQLQAMGISAEDAQGYIARNQQITAGPTTDDYESLFTDAAKAVSPQNYIASHYKEYGFGSSSGLYDAYELYTAEQEAKQEKQEATSGNPGTVAGNSGVRPDTQSAEPRESVGVFDSRTGEFIPRTDTRIRDVVVHENGDTYYIMMNGRILVDETSKPLPSSGVPIDNFQRRQVMKSLDNPASYLFKQEET
jgi:hypothetical protein